MSSNIKETMNSMTETNIINDTINQAQQNTSQSLRQSVEQSLKQYFNELDGQKTNELYDLFMQQVEAPLFECVMQHTQDNQSKAAALLGLNRGTLRKKLKQYDLL
ncbi:MAG: DNA-binding transcriptional regulator Fis [Gammaproteobacteria bacterium]|nr:DNA-binding transcriptional regulator Fis [Gammaproteobacteria bacterium]